MPAAVYTALNNAKFTAAFTDIRPEDAKFAQCRVASTLEAVDYTALGYGTTALSACATAPTLIGTSILSEVTAGATNAQPVAFNISGTDPFTGIAIPKYTTVPIGVSPIIFVENKSDTTAGGLGAAGALHNVTLASIQAVYTTGAHCDTNTLAGVSPSKPLTVFNREPMSGTFNTTEFTNFRLTGSHHTKTQEFGINPANANNNPLDLACGIGTRERSIGTGEEIKGVLNTTNSVGYAFFSYANIQPIAGSANYGYMTVQGIDPLYSTYTTGELPTCSEPCPATPGDSFPQCSQRHLPDLVPSAGCYRRVGRKLHPHQGPGCRCPGAHQRNRPGLCTVPPSGRWRSGIPALSLALPTGRRESEQRIAQRHWYRSRWRYGRLYRTQWCTSRSSQLPPVAAS